mmetsp:Transcript_31748/g.86854  ORF Transcript_31748/g.86854 Transcript_31748/m.86854 type:complete len:352 (+) Transcript_31748:2096-3151(+)
MSGSTVAEATAELARRRQSRPPPMPLMPPMPPMAPMAPMKPPMGAPSEQRATGAAREVRMGALPVRHLDLGAAAPAAVAHSNDTSDSLSHIISSMPSPPRERCSPRDAPPVLPQLGTRSLSLAKRGTIGSTTVLSFSSRAAASRAARASLSFARASTSESHAACAGCDGGHSRLWSANCSACVSSSSDVCSDATPHSIARSAAHAAPAFWSWWTSLSSSSRCSAWRTSSSRPTVPSTAPSPVATGAGIGSLIWAVAPPRCTVSRSSDGARFAGSNTPLTRSEPSAAAGTATRASVWSGHVTNESSSTASSSASRSVVSRVSSSCGFAPATAAANSESCACVAIGCATPPVW